MTYLEHLHQIERGNRRMAIMWAILASLNIIPLVLDIIHHDWRMILPHLTLIVLQVVLALCEYSSMRDQQRLQQLTIQIEALQSSLDKQRTLADEYAKQAHSIPFGAILQEMVEKYANETPQPDSRLGDLGLDSLDMVELTMEIESRFQIVIPDEELWQESWRDKTLRDLTKYVLHKMWEE
jgi:acyl carrier protein